MTAQLTPDATEQDIAQVLEQHLYVADQDHDLCYRLTPNHGVNIGGDPRHWHEARMRHIAEDVLPGVDVTADHLRFIARYALGEEWALRIPAAAVEVTLR